MGAFFKHKLMGWPQDHADFNRAWASFKKAGYQYGSDAIEQVRFGFEIAHGRTPHDH
jgi:hypothetical protein